MSNNLSVSFPEYWSKRMQLKHYKNDVFRTIVSMEEQSTLQRGDTVHRPYRSSLSVNNLGAEGNYTRQDITDTDESLVINKEKEVSFYIRKIDEMQSNYETANEYADDAAVLLGNQIDGDVLGEYQYAASDVDDGDLGATNNNGIVLTTANLDKVFGEANEALDALNIPQDRRFACISPQFFNVLWQRIGGRESVLGDSTSLNGDVGKYAGFRLRKTNSLSWTGVLSMATQPTDGDTVVIRGVTFTFKTTLGSTAGNVLIGGSADAARVNLTALINTPGTTTAQGVALSAANQALLKNFTATDSPSGDTMTVVATGVSYISVSETFTDLTDTWTEALQIQHNLFGREGAIDLVIQKQPNMVLKDRDGYLGKDVVSWTVYGKKTFAQGADELVDVKIKSANF